MTKKRFWITAIIIAIIAFLTFWVLTNSKAHAISLDPDGEYPQQHDITVCHTYYSEAWEGFYHQTLYNQEDEILKNKSYTRGECEEEVTPTPTVTVVPSVSPTATPEATLTPTATPTAPPSPHGDGLSDGRESGHVNAPSTASMPKAPPNTGRGR